MTSKVDKERDEEQKIKHDDVLKKRNLEKQQKEKDDKQQKALQKARHANAQEEKRLAKQQEKELERQQKQQHEEVLEKKRLANQLNKIDSATESRANKRLNQFLEERMATLGPKGKGQGRKAALRADFRRQLISEYRKRQVPQQPRTKTTQSALLENTWIPIGPSVVLGGQAAGQPPISGRVKGIAAAPGGNLIYVGAANGGVWRSDDAGQSWRSLMDAFDLNPTTDHSDSLAVGAIAIDPANPDRVYVGSGEGGGAYYGVGPIVTNNGTANPPSWHTEETVPGSPPLAGSAFYALAVDPANPERVMAGTTYGLYRREPNGKGGFHWAQKTMGENAGQSVTSVVAATSGGITTFYAAQSGGPIYSSKDGETWKQAGNRLPQALGRISLAVRPDNPNVVYAFTQDSDVYRYRTADDSWRKIRDVPAKDKLTGDQGSYDLAIAVAPDNVNRIYLGGAGLLFEGEWNGAIYRCEVMVNGADVYMEHTYIGGSVHPDIHCLVFAPGDANKLWVGCDGGVFYSANPTSDPTNSKRLFSPRNTGLQTMTMNYLAQHPTEPAVLFAGTQDNGGQRYTGEEAWLVSSLGDCGYVVVNWNNPYRILDTYTYGAINRSEDGGTRNSYYRVNVPLAKQECLPYPPLAMTPPNPFSPTAEADADLVAFGSVRPWISLDFGSNWQSIPTNTLEGDSLNGMTLCLMFASPKRLYAGTVMGGVYRFDRTGEQWTRTRLDTTDGENGPSIIGQAVTDITVDPADDNRFHITFGGKGGDPGVWFFDGVQWQGHSAPVAEDVASLPDIQAPAMGGSVNNPARLYVNWNNSQRILAPFTYGFINRSESGGTSGSYYPVNVPLVLVNEECSFYAPLAGTPPNLGSRTAAVDADLVAFGSIRPWISPDFGDNWQSIPTNTVDGDRLDSLIRCLTFASPNRLYAGTVMGGVYRFDRMGEKWTRVQINTIRGTNQLLLSGPITDIAVDPTDDTRVYITFGGGPGDYRRVWFFDGAGWQQRSGPAAGNVNSLLDVQATAIDVDPNNPTHLYVGADIGVWRSLDSGLSWASFSQGLPDAGVTDLLLHNPSRLLRAATHGRGVYERSLSDTHSQGVELYIRSTELDQGRSPAVDGLPNPTGVNSTVNVRNGPDIKIDQPNQDEYQVPLTGAMDFYQFADKLSKDFNGNNGWITTTENIVTRVYVQVHNRGIVPADKVRVMLMVADASGDLPPLPAGLEVNLRNGLPIDSDGWQTVGFDTLNDVRVGFPRIAAFDLPTNMLHLLPPSISEEGQMQDDGQKRCVLALVHQAQDHFANAEVNADTLNINERKAAYKFITFRQYMPSPPEEPPPFDPFNPFEPQPRFPPPAGHG